MEWYAIPALLALLLKLSVIYLAREGTHVSRLFFGMLLIFALFNLSEALIILGLFQGTVSEYLLRSYYAIMCCAQAYLCLYGLEVAYRAISRWAVVAISGVVIALVVVVLATDAVVAGAESIGYTVTAVRGDFYFLFHTLMLSCFLIAMGMLAHGYFLARDKSHQIQCAYTFIAISPMTIASVVVVILMIMGFSLSAALILPIATTAFLYLSLRSEEKHGLTDIGRFLRPSTKRVTANVISDVTDQYLNDEMSLKEAKDSFEKHLLQHNLDRFDHNVSKTARVLGMKRTTIYSMLKKHGMKAQGSTAESD